MMVKPIFGLLHVYYFLFSSLAFAAVQNVTVDDAVSVGAVVPQYLPAAVDWNQGNGCSVCLAKPNVSLAYDGTWHDTSYTSGSGIYQSLEFTFTGSALYIYCILANTIPGAPTYATELNFLMDGEFVGTPFIHSPTTSTDYEYNVPVYVNESIPFGTHDMVVNLVYTNTTIVLILFDYLVYTTDTDLVSTSSSILQSAATSSPQLPSASSSSSSSSSSAGTQGTTSNAAIIGGTVGGIAALAVVIVSLLCYWRRRKRRGELEQPVMAAFPTEYIAPPVPTFLKGSSTQAREVSTFAESHRSATSQPANPSIAADTRSPSSIDFEDRTTPAPSSSGGALSSQSGTAQILSQVELLRDGVARILEFQGQSPPGRQSMAPPEYHE